VVGEGFAEKEGFKPGMKECVFDGKLIIIISVTVSSINFGAFAFSAICLQRFNTVGWAPGRASGL